MIQRSKMSTRRRKDSNLLAVTQRSNALAFSHRHFLTVACASPGPPLKRRHSIVQVDVNSSLMTKDNYSPLMSVAEHARTDVIASPQSIKSLIPPAIHIHSSRQRNATYKRRSSSSSLKSFSSVTSMTSSMFSRKRKYTAIPNLATMPAEILSCIFQYLNQCDHHNLMLTNSNLLESAAMFTYNHPYFASTYRYAQFAYTVSHNPSYACMVRILDLNYFTKDLDEDGELPPQAGWRDFTYRHHNMHHSRDRLSIFGIKHNPSGSSHPLPNPLLKNFHRTRDLPVGAICHVLAACKEIRKINISRLQLTIDYSLSHSSSPPTATTCLIYNSDMPNAHIPLPTTRLLTLTSPDISPPHTFSRPFSPTSQPRLTPVTIDSIISHLHTLPNLEEIKAKDFLWLTGEKVKTLIEGCKTLVKLDFRGSGMNRDSTWAIKGSREEILRIIGG